MMSDDFLKTKQPLIISISKIYCRQGLKIKSHVLETTIRIYIYNGLLSS